MVRAHTILPLSISSSSALIQTLPSVPNTNNSPGPILHLPTNTSRTLTSDPLYTCIGGSKYGAAIPLYSCQEAAHSILEALPYSHREKLTFGDRRGAGGGRGVEVQLPYISIDCTYVAYTQDKQ